MPQDIKKEIHDWYERIKHAQGDMQCGLFIQYCLRLIQLKEEQDLTEEQVGYHIVGVTLGTQFKSSPECDAIIDMAMTVEKSRFDSHAQPIGTWNEQTAEHIKQSEWNALVTYIRSVTFSPDIVSE